MLENLTFTAWQVSLVSIVSGLFGFLISHRLSLGRDRRKEFCDAGKEFLDAFVEVQRLLEINPPVNPAIGNEWQKTIKLVRRFYQQHHSAVVRFEHHIPWHKKASFRNCWYEYCCYDKQNNCETFSDYTSELMNQELEKRRLAISRVRKLLKFTRV